MRNTFGAKKTRNNFVPASRYYGDRYPRTMEEAFGPGAKLSEQETVVDATAISCIIFMYAAGVVAIIMLALWWAT